MSNLLDLPPEFALDLSLGSDLSSFGEFLIHGLTLHGKPFRTAITPQRRSDQSLGRFARVLQVAAAMR